MRSLATAACAVTLIGASTAFMAPAHAGILPTNVAALSTVDTSHVIDVRWGWRGGGWGWRGGGWGRGWGWGGAAVAAGVLGGALVASSYYSPYAYGYGYPAYDYGYSYG